MVRNVDAATPNPPKVDISRDPSEEQPAQALETTLSDEPEKSDLIPLFKPLKCLMTYRFMLITAPARTAVIFDTINPPTESSGR